MLWLYSQVCVEPGNEAAHKMQKWGFTRYTLFLFALKHRMWVLIKTSIRNQCFAQTLKNIYIKILHMKIVIFTVAKITVYIALVCVNIRTSSMPCSFAEWFLFVLF